MSSGSLQRHEIADADHSCRDPSGYPGVHSMKPPNLQTKRLVLRRWTDEDRDHLARIHADPEVMKYRLTPLTRKASDDLIDQIEACFDENGFGLWAVERKQDRCLLGFTGLEVADIDAPFCPAVQIGWQLATDAWGQGYATEGATAVLDFAFGELRLSEVVAHTTVLNRRSQAVMSRLGMTHDPTDDFEGPWYSVGHPHRPYVLYRIKATKWMAQGRGAP